MDKTILIVGYYGFHNTGDEAILAAMLGELRKKRPSARMIVTSAAPGETAAAHSVECIHWSNIVDLTRAVQECDAVLIGGGGLFHDYGNFDPNAVLTDQHSDIGYYATPALLGALYGKPVMLYAVGVGPLFSSDARRFTRVVSKIAQTVTVRDSASRLALEEIGIPGDRIQVTADAAFGFGEIPTLEPVEEDAGETLIHVAVRHWEHEVASEVWEGELAESLDRFLADHAGRVVFVPFQHLPGQKEDDETAGRRIQGKMTYADRTSLFEPGKTAGEIYRELQTSSLILGMRLHSIVFGILAHVPVIALSYDAKVEETMRLAGMERNSLKLETFRAADLTRAMQDTLAEAPGIRAHLRVEAEKLRARAAETATLADELLGRADVHLPEVDEEFLTILRESLVGHVKEVQDLKSEIHRLVKEVEFYLLKSRHSGLLAEQQAHAALVIQKDAADQSRLADQSREKILLSLDRFEQTFQEELAGYRSQRAWKAMLLFRKAYSMLVRGNWTERASFLKYLLRVPADGFGALNEHELRFPNVWNFIPEEWERRVQGPLAAKQELPAVRKVEDNFPQQQMAVVVLPVIDFDYRFQRPQQIAVELARRGHRVFWISPSRVLPLAGQRYYETVPLRENLFEVHLPVPQHNIYTGTLTSAGAGTFQECLEHLFEDEGIAESIALLQFPFWRQVGLSLRAKFDSRLVYDCMDDWSAWTTEPKISAFSLSEEQMLSVEADVVVVSSQEFSGQKEALGAKPVLARNGTDFEFFHSPRFSQAFRDMAGPIIGYYGAISEWFDLELVTYLVKARPDYSFVLIGQVHAVDVSELVALPNVRLTGEKHYRELPQLLSEMQVCLIPFRLNRLTRGVDPVKLYEYFSQGKPVIATEMAELPMESGLLYIGKDAEDFVRKVDEAVAEDDPEMRSRRLDFARENSWKARADVIEAAIVRTFPQVSILVVTYNSEEYLDKCLLSIRRNTAWPAFEVIVVDNASTDSTFSVAGRHASADPRVRAISMRSNLGFAAANNRAAREADGDYLVFLNPDTVVTPGWLHRFVAHVRKDPMIGQLAAVTNFSGNETKINFDYSNAEEMLEFAKRRANHFAGMETDLKVAPLYCVFMPRAAWERVGELDESYRVGMFEDDDLSLRVKRAGYRVAAADDVFIHHFGNGSFKKLPSADSIRIFEENRKRFEEKWEVTWEPHRFRPRVRPLSEEVLFTPEGFFDQTVTGRAELFVPVLKALHPRKAVAGELFNPQPGGMSALVVNCEQAVPGTVIRIDGVSLVTSFGNTETLSAIVPVEVTAKPGVRVVSLLNDFGESNSMEFVLEAPAGNGHG